MYVATIDGGTSNTRVYIWKDGQIIGQARSGTGVRNTAIDGDNHQVMAAVHDTLAQAAQAAGLEIGDISLLLAAGMLTSEAGLCEIPHVTAPVTLDGLAAAMVSKSLPAVCPQPIWFVPGVRNSDPAALTADSMLDMDIMRGEETEAAGLLAYAVPQGRAVFVLPGSHNKYVLIDEQQQIQGCLTTLGGEVLRSLTFDTILAETVARSFATAFDGDAFLKGVIDWYRLGFLHGAFMTRLLGLFAHDTPLQAQNYLLGLLLADELHSLRQSKVFTFLDEAVFVIAGRPVMQAAYQKLFSYQGWQSVLATEKQQQGLSGYGAIYLAQRRGLLNGHGE